MNKISINHLNNNEVYKNILFSRILKTPWCSNSFKMAYCQKQVKILKKILITLSSICNFDSNCVFYNNY